MTGQRYNSGKPRFSLITPIGLTELAKVYTFGAIKYAANNWRKGLSWTETADSAMRHINAWLDGENIEPESGCHHLAHAAWNCLTLVHFALTGTGTDDRYTPPPEEVVTRFKQEWSESA